MATKRKSAARKPGQVPSPEPIKYPESEFKRFQRAKLVEVDAAQAEHEQKWGIGRVTTLVPTEFRVKFYAQAERVWAAQTGEDVAKFGAACDGMIRAYKAMNSWAIAEGIEPVTKVNAIEADTQLGIMVIVKDEADANQYLALRKDVVQVWTVAEIVELVKAGIGQAIWEMKEQLPVRGTLVQVQQESRESEESRQRPSAQPAASGGVKQQMAAGEAVGRAGASGFEDLENDIDLDAEVEFPKMWTGPHKVEARK
jgi:hypothetical protein